MGSSSPVEMKKQTLQPFGMRFIFIMLISCLAVTTVVVHQDVIARFTSIESGTHHKELRKALGLSLVPGVRTGALDSSRREAVHTALAPLLRTLPKADDDRLSASVVRYMVNRYFGHKYGWKIRGVESFQDNTTKLSSAVMLKEKLPTYVDGVLQTLEVDGFLEDDAVMLTAAMEQLIFDNILESVESSYHINEVPLSSSLDKSKMVSILQSFLIEALLESNFTDTKRHFKLKKKHNIEYLFPNWETVNLFMEDIVGVDAHEAELAASPLSKGSRPTYRFENTVAIAQRTVEEFGPWFHHECSKMTDALSEMDPHETGRVRIVDFYHSSSEAAWHFQESENYLRQLGALDESSPALGPQVIIPNYVAGVNNCVLPGKYFSVCCINECEGIQGQLEARINRARAPVTEVADAMQELFGRNLSTPNGARSTTLLSDLNEVAKINQGEVSLHSRLFAQWLHFAFPRTCPYPHASGSLRPETPAEHEARAGVDAVIASDGELAKHLISTAHLPPSPTAGVNMWVTHEEHIHKHQAEYKTTIFGNVLLILALGALATGVGVAIKRLLSLGHQDKDQDFVPEKIETVVAV